MLKGRTRTHVKTSRRRKSVRDPKRRLVRRRTSPWGFTRQKHWGCTGRVPESKQAEVLRVQRPLKAGLAANVVAADDVPDCCCVAVVSVPGVAIDRGTTGGTGRYTC